MQKTLIWILLLGSFLSADSVQHTSSARNANSQNNILWTIDIPDMDLINISNLGLEYPGWNHTVLGNGMRVPVKTKLMYTQTSPPSGDALLVDPQSFHFVDASLARSDQAKGMDAEALSQSDISEELISFKLIKHLEGYDLWAVNVLGGQYDPTSRQWIIPSQIAATLSVDISLPASSGSEDLYLNKLNESIQRPMRINRTGLGNGKIKLFVLKDGIYRIYYDSLAVLPDFPEEIISSRSLKLRERGEQQAIHVTDHGDGIFNGGDHFDFIGKQKYFEGTSQYYDAFSDINVYWLDWGGEDGLRFVEESGALVDLTPVRPTTFWDEIHIEQDNDFERLGQVDTNLPSITRDHFFWESVNSGVTKEVEYYLPNPFRGSSENLEVSLGLHGLTYSQEAGDVQNHTIFAFMNDHSIGDGSWVQQEEYVLTSPAALNLSHNILNANGHNSLAIFAPVSTEPGNYDKVVLNWIEIGYEHLLRADDNQLRFRKSYINPSTDLEYEIQGFESQNMVLYKEGLSKITGFTIRENWDASEPQYSLVFQDHSTESTPDYWAASFEGILRPLRATVDTLAQLREQDADLIVITIPDFMDNLEPYLEFKRSEGWNPIAVSAADIYDEFNWGVHSPLAIKAFLRYANNYWSSHPEYVVLIGDAISNPQQAKRDTRIRNIPTFYMQTYGWGAAEADYWYSLINGDDYLPDLNIGRLPCNDLIDLNSSLTKLIQYGSGSNYGAWQNEIITIAGFDATFKSQSESLLRTAVPAAYMPSRIFIDRDSEGQIFWGDTDSLVEHWNRGKLLINFLGHGGGAVWADRSLFVRDDIFYLNQDTPPAFVTSMTCFTASFAQTRGLGEVVLTESPVGAIGWFGSSGVGWIINDYLMIQPLMRRLLEDNKTVGEIINIARMEYFLANSGFDYLKPSMLFQYNFLGDPTTRLLRPERQDLLASTADIYGVDEQISLQYIGNQSGEIKLLPLNAYNQPWWTLPQSYAATQGANIVLSQETGAPEGMGRSIITLDRGVDQTAYQGFVSYSVSSDWFEHESPTAEQLSESPIIPIRVRYHSNSASVDSMVMVLSGANSGRIELERDEDWWQLADTTRLDAGNSQTYYSFSAFSQGTLLKTSASYTLYLPQDISLSTNELRSGVKDNRCGIYLDYTLMGLPDASATLHFDADLSGTHQIIDAEVAITGGNNAIFVPFLMGIDTIQASATLHISSDLDHSDNSIVRQLSSNYYQILPGLGISFNGLASDTLPLWSSGSLLANPVDTAWVRVGSYMAEIPALPGVVLYEDSTIYSIEVSNPEIVLQIEAPQSIFRKDAELPNWRSIDHGSAPSSVSSELSQIRSRTFLAMGQIENFTGPQVSMMVEGQLFFDGDYLLESSHLNLLAEDENGFSWHNSDVRVTVDGGSLTPQLGDTTSSGKILSATIPLDLETGEHTINYMVSDALGNWSDEVSITGTVASQAAIYDYGNFPNPFEGETLIIYELTQPLDDLEIDIFTLSGYKLHTIDAFNARVSIGLGAIGYHEVPWNGRDRSDDFVSNGVYFYRIKGKMGNEDIVGPIGKMVKNR